MNKQRRVIDLDGCHIYYLKQGQGYPVLLVHGLGSYSYTWRHNIDALASEYQVFAIDLKGFGYSDKPQGKGYSLNDHVKMIQQFITALGLERVHYIGSSMGGEIGMRLCLDTPNLIKKLILIGSSGYRDKISLSVQILSRLPYRMFVRPILKKKYGKEALAEIIKFAFYDSHSITNEEIEQYLVPMRSDDFAKAFLSLLREFDFGKRKEDYSHIKHQTLILAGQYDRLIPYKDSARLADELKNSRLTVIPQTGHFMHEEKPEHINQLILCFLNEPVPLGKEHRNHVFS